MWEKPGVGGAREWEEPGVLSLAQETMGGGFISRR